jgi:hypothetical protein
MSARSKIFRSVQIANLGERGSRAKNGRNKSLSVVERLFNSNFLKKRKAAMAAKQRYPQAPVHPR